MRIHLDPSLPKDIGVRHAWRRLWFVAWETVTIGSFFWLMAGYGVQTPIWIEWIFLLGLLVLCASVFVYFKWKERPMGWAALLTVVLFLIFPVIAYAIDWVFSHRLLLEKLTW